MNAVCLSRRQASTIKRVIRTFKIPPYALGAGLCYYQDMSIESFEALCLCLYMGCKINEDYKVRASLWSKYTNVSCEWLVRHERYLMRLYDYHMHLPNERVFAATVLSQDMFY